MTIVATSSNGEHKCELSQILFLDVTLFQQFFVYENPDHIRSCQKISKKKL